MRTEFNCETGEIITDLPDAPPSLTPSEEAAQQEADIDNHVNTQITERGIIRALVLALNDGSLTPGANHTPQELRQIIRSKL